jgi:ketosteroid isomerase-like protein
MKRIVTMVAVALAGALPAHAQADAGAGADAEREVREAVERFGRAFADADASALDPMLTKDYVHTNWDGAVLGKSGWLDYVRSRRAQLDSGTLRIDAHTTDDLKVRLYGDVAVVTGRNTTRGKRGGDAFETRIRFTHVWVKQDGSWRRAAFHDSTIAEPSE